jgi:hypothetical protein
MAPPYLVGDGSLVVGCGFNHGLKMFGKRHPPAHGAPPQRRAFSAIEETFNSAARSAMVAWAGIGAE